MKAYFAAFVFAISFASWAGRDEPPTSKAKIIAASSNYPSMTVGAHIDGIAVDFIIGDLEFFLRVLGSLLEIREMSNEPIPIGLEVRLEDAYGDMTRAVANFERSRRTGQLKTMSFARLTMRAIENHNYLALRFLVNHWLREEDRQVVMGTLQFWLSHAFDVLRFRASELGASIRALEEEIAIYRFEFLRGTDEMAQIETAAEQTFAAYPEIALAPRETLAAYRNHRDRLFSIRKRLNDERTRLEQRTQEIQARINELNEAVGPHEALRRQIVELQVEYQLGHFDRLNEEITRFVLPAGIPRALAEQVPWPTHWQWFQIADEAIASPQRQAQQRSRSLPLSRHARQRGSLPSGVFRLFGISGASVLN